MTPALFLLCVDVDPFTPASGCVVDDENSEFIPNQCNSLSAEVALKSVVIKPVKKSILLL